MSEPGVPQQPWPHGGPQQHQPWIGAGPQRRARTVGEQVALAIAVVLGVLGLAAVAFCAWFVIAFSSYGSNK